MTDKTPAQQAIEKLISLKDSSNRECRIQAFDEAIGVIKSLLPTEKEFAGKVFDAGVDYGRQASHHANKQQFLNRYYKP